MHASEEFPEEHGDENDLLTRFETLSRNFRSEVQTLFGQEKETAKDLNRLQQRNAELEKQLQLEREEAQGIGAAIQRFFANQVSEEGEIEQCVPSYDLRGMVEALIEVSSAEVRPEVLQAQKEMAELRCQLEAARGEAERLHWDLLEARKLKSQEERELIEFKALREKENELQTSKMEVQQLEAELQEARAAARQLEENLTQQGRSLQEKSDKIISLVQQLDNEVEQVRLLSDENNTLRLELGRDTDYLKVVSAIKEPLSYRSAAGALDEELSAEDLRFREELRGIAAKFPGLGGNHCSRWCELQVSRVSDLHLSFLHRLQDFRKDFPEDVKVEFTTPTEEVQKDWLEQEAMMTQASMEFQEAETKHGRKWEEYRLKLTSERDAKVKQLLDQAERSQSKAEKQLLLHQAKLYGQRIDGQLEKAWEEQRKERDMRWTQHQQQKQELRQKIKEESFAVVQRAEDQASASSRFAEAASGKLAAVEDTWLRNAEKASALNASTLKGKDFEATLQLLKNTVANAAVSLSCSGVTKTEKPIPARGSQYTGVGLAVDQVEELLQNRAFLRLHLREELEQQSRQQLRGCVERFILREGEQDSPEELPPCEQAASMASLLQMRQHRHLTDVMRRQFQDYLLALRLCSLAALWLLPSGVLPVSEDLPPPVKLESLDGTAGRCQGEAENDADAAEGRFLYRTLCQQLLDRTLRILSDLQRDELLALKRANAAEQRLTLQQLCQLEPDQIEKAQQLDLKEFEAQVTLRLLSDAERQINDEHKKQTCRVSQDVELQLVQYKREVQEAEQVIVQERHKWLTNRIVVLQSSGSGTVNPNDRPLLSRLRAELQACEVKMEAYKRDLAMVPAPEPCNEPRPRRHSDELASAQAPLAPLALWQRPHRGLRLCESPDFGRPREPRDHRDHREHRDWRPPLSQSTRMKGDIFGGYKEMSIPTQAEPLGSPPRQVKMSPGKRPKLPPVPLSAR